MNEILIMYLIITLICWLFIALGIVIYAKHLKMKKRAKVKTSARVAYIRERYDSEDGKLHTPVFEFFAGERKIVKVYDVSSNRPEYQLNQQVNIAYNPENPEEFYVEGNNSLKMICGVSAALGVFVWCVMTVFFVCIYLFW